jgi:hypothetical protein
VIGNESRALIASLLEGLDFVELCNKMTLIYVLRVRPKKHDIFLDNYCLETGEPDDAIYDAPPAPGAPQCSHFHCKDQRLTNLDKLYFRISFKVFLVIEQLAEALPDLSLLEVLGFKKVDWNPKWGPLAKKMARKAVVDGAIARLTGFEGRKSQEAAPEDKKPSHEPEKGKEPSDPANRTAGVRVASADDFERRKSMRPSKGGLQAGEELAVGMLEQVVRVWFQQCQQFFSSYVGSVEVLNQNGQIVKVHFQIPYCCKYTSQEIKRAILHDVNRSSDQERLEDFFSKRKLYEFQMKVLQRLSFNRLLFLLVSNLRLLRLLHFLTLLVINVLILFFHVNDLDPSAQNDRHKIKIYSDGKSRVVLEFPSPYYQWAFRMLQSLQLLLLLICTAISIFQNFPGIMHTSIAKTPLDASTSSSSGAANTEQKPASEVQNLEEVLKRTTLLRKARLVLSNAHSIYNLAVIAVSILAVVYSNLVYSVLMLELLWVSPALLSVFKTLLREHAAKAGLASLIVLIAVFFFSVLAFYYQPGPLNEVPSSH